MAVHRTVRVQHSATHPDRGAITLDGDTLTLIGEVDHGLVARWTAEAPADVTATTVDARAVTFLGSAGLALLAGLARATPSRVVLLTEQRVVTRPLTVTGLDALFEIRPD